MYTVNKPTHRKLTIVANSRREILEQLLEADARLPIDDPIVIRCDGAQFISEVYIVSEDVPGKLLANMITMRV
jgi:hypothetical protein